MSYRHRRVVVTGGLGFLGSNLVLALLDQGAHVTVIDSLVPGCGGSRENLGGAADSVNLILRDIGEANQFVSEISRADCVFNLAGEISHLHSMRDPLRDFVLNAESQLRFLLTLSRVNPGVRVVYAGTRQIYGRPRSLPVSETHPVDIVDFNGIHKFAAGEYHALLTRQNLLNAIVLRLTNAYGPRLALHVNGQGFLGVFFRQAMDGQAIDLYGGGAQLRDPVFSGDVTRAFLLAGEVERPRSRVYNVGGPESISLCQLAEKIYAASGQPAQVRSVPFPPQQAQVDIGSYVSDWSRIQAELGWKPKVRFSQGASQTVRYFQSQESALKQVLAQPQTALPG